MKVKILNHNKLSAGVKVVNASNIYTKENIELILTGKSYDNFIKYVMYLWGGDQKSTDVVTKIVNNNGCYCFYKN